MDSTNCDILENQNDSVQWGKIGIEFVKCLQCPYESQDLDDVHSHFIELHQSPVNSEVLSENFLKLYKCTINGCKREYFSKDSLQKHVRNKHLVEASSTFQGKNEIEVIKCPKESAKYLSVCEDCHDNQGQKFDGDKFKRIFKRLEVECEKSYIHKEQLEHNLCKAKKLNGTLKVESSESDIQITESLFQADKSKTEYDIQLEPDDQIMSKTVKYAV